MNTNNQTQPTFKELLAAKVAEQQAKAEQLRLEAQMKLLDDEKYLESVRKTEAMREETSRLNTIMRSLNTMEPFVTPKGEKFGIRCFPVSFFGLGHSLVMGIVLSSSQAFTEEKLMEYSAISGVNEILLQQAVLAFGRPAYFSKDGKLVDEEKGDFEEFSALLTSVYMELGLMEFAASDITEAKYNAYFDRELKKAVTQKEEFEKAEVLDNEGGDFVIND